MDDDPSVLRALWRQLRRARPELQVNAVSTVAQAMQALSELSYDAVICDLQMPGGGGQVVLNALARDFPETARIVHSSQLETSDTTGVHRLSHVVLPKPAREADLVAAIENALQSALSSRPLASRG